MTDREKAIVMAHTGICMLEGEKLGAFYQYLEELYGRPVYTHEWFTLDIKEKSKPDFLQLCKEEEPERKKGEWISKGYGEYRCSSCRNIVDLDEEILMSIKSFYYCPVCGAYMRKDQNGKSNIR